jgi:hypothetical protein
VPWCSRHQSEEYKAGLLVRLDCVEQHLAGLVAITAPCGTVKPGRHSASDSNTGLQADDSFCSKLSWTVLVMFQFHVQRNVGTDWAGLHLPWSLMASAQDGGQHWVCSHFGQESSKTCCYSCMSFCCHQFGRLQYFTFSFRLNYRMVYVLIVWKNWLDYGWSYHSSMHP